MSRIVLVENLSLDGVMQGPGRPDEDPRGGFTQGGWALPYRDAEMGQAMSQGMADAGPMLFGRRTYEDFYSVWPKRKDNPYTEVLNNAQKFVVSTTLKEPLPWQNSTLLTGKALDAVTTLKEQSVKNIVILGSGELVRSLIPHRLIDDYVLLIHPLVVGSGRRLFADEAAFATLKLVRSTTTSKGVVIATYRTGE